VVVAALLLLLRLRPSLRNLSIRICVVAVTCLETISLGFGSGDERAMSVNISPPVRIFSRPRALAPLRRIGLTTRQIPFKKLPIP